MDTRGQLNNSGMDGMSLLLYIPFVKSTFSTLMTHQTYKFKLTIMTTFVNI